MHSECCARLTLDDLSATAGVHPCTSRVSSAASSAKASANTRAASAFRVSCRYLLDPELPLAEISLLTGFADPKPLHPRIFAASPA